MKTKPHQTPRQLIVGMGESGKTLLAKRFAAGYEKAGYSGLIYDPIEDGGWPESFFATSDEELFFEEIAATSDEGKRRVLFVDEAHELLSIGQKENHWLATKGRHHFSAIAFITQRPTLISPTIRTQCNTLFCFNVSADDAKMLANDFAHEGILEAPKLLQGQFLICQWRDGKKTVDTGRIF